MEVPIKYVDWGVGNLIDGVIYLNWRLKAYPELEMKVIRHELAHAQGTPGVDWNERWNWDMFWFIVQNRSTWIQYLPVWLSKENHLTIIINWNVVWFWLLVLACGVAIVAEYAWLH